jgi:dTDP-4-dehydrorhamnose reductase
MKILVIGKNGQLGKSIHKCVTNNEKTEEFVFIGREDLDLSINDNIASYFDYNNFDVIINCAAYTTVDKAEEEEVLANQINNLAVAQLAKIAKRQQSKFIHISTDYVFDGESDRSYTETDAANPVNIYGKTKLAGERVLKEIMPNDAIIIRTSWVYSEYGNNFVKTMLRLGEERGELSVVSDQRGSPTYATDLANAVLDIVQKVAFKEVGQETQVYHYSNFGEISWYEFAQEIFRLQKLECRVNPVLTDQYKTSARRPKNTLMDKTKIEEMFDLHIVPWKVSLKKCLTFIQ